MAIDWKTFTDAEWQRFTDSEWATFIPDPIGRLSVYSTVAMGLYSAGATAADLYRQPVGAYAGNAEQEESTSNVTEQGLYSAGTP